MPRISILPLLSNYILLSSLRIHIVFVFEKYFPSPLLLAINFLFLHTLGTKIEGSPVFSIKNISILNGHNFGPKRRTEIKKKQFEQRSADFSNIDAKFFKILKTEVTSHDNQSSNFLFISLADFLRLSLLRIFFSIYRIRINRKIIFSASNSFFSRICTIFFGGVTSL